MIGAKLSGWSEKAWSRYRQFERAELSRQLRHSDGPILVGPFRGEVGFEALYWIPWLQKLQSDLQLPPERLIPISRAGAACWYGCPTGIELYSLKTPQDLRVQNRLNQQKYGVLKQITYDAFDRDVVEETARQLNLQQPVVIHPRHMYQHLAPFWTGHRGFSWLLQHTAYKVPLMTLPLDLKLPEKFVAVRFYARATFPATPQTTVLAEATIRRLAQSVPVVLLNNGLHQDEHMDFQVEGPNITTIRDYTTISDLDNLAIVSSVMARAMGFVGTYGGLAQLALMLGKPSVSFYSEWQGTATAHWHLSNELSLRTGVPFVVHKLSEVPLVSSILPLMAVQTTSPSGLLAHEPVTA